MSIVTHNFDQYSEEYWALKLGRPSASKIAKSILNSQGKPAAGQTTYMHTLLAEEMAGAQLDSFQNDAMKRGLEMEPDAVGYYEFVTDQTTSEVGCITNPSVNEHVVISPDRWTPDNNVPGLEVKCPGPPNQIAYLLGNKCPPEYFPQVQCSMWITEQDHWDFVSYHPELDCLLITVNRDDAWIKLLADEMDSFMEKLEKKKQKLAA